MAMRLDDKSVVVRYSMRIRGTPIGQEQPFKAPKVPNDKNIAICLSCDMPNCKGSCKKIKRNAEDTSNGKIDR